MKFWSRSFCGPVFISPGWMPRSGMAEPCGMCVFCFMRSGAPFSHWYVCSWSCSSSLPLYDVVSLFSYSHSGGCRVGELVKNCLQRGLLNQELKLRKLISYKFDKEWGIHFDKSRVSEEEHDAQEQQGKGNAILLDLVSSFKNFGSFSERGWGIIGIFWCKYGMAWLTYF